MAAHKCETRSSENPYTKLHRKLWSISGAQYDHCVRRGYKIAAKSRPRPPKPFPAGASEAERVEYLWDCLEIEEQPLLELDEKEAQEKSQKKRRKITWRKRGEKRSEC